MSSDEDLDDDFYDDDGISESDQIMPPVRFLRLLPYLDLVRDAAYTPAQLWLGKPPSLTMVMGNPSADLDSFVSAVILAYFHNSGVPGGSPMYRIRKSLDPQHSSRQFYMSLINMPKTSSQSDLKRLRPEFGVALKEAFKVGNERKSDVKWANEKPDEVGAYLCKKLLTTYDLVKYDQAFQTFKIRFEPASNEDNDRQPECKQPLILVDHNAPSMPSLTPEHVSKQFSVTGCIDHHIDEDYVSHASHIRPRVIQTGIGSCATLVVKYLREAGLWPDITKHSLDKTTNKYIDPTTSSDLDADDISALRQLSTLALAPILIDTSNLHAAGEKCSPLDHEVVGFLESQISSAPTIADDVATQFSRNDFYDELSTAKTNSLNLLSMSEIFERDYKQWSDDAVIGISTIVKPLSWLVANPCKGKESTFVSEMISFSTSPDKKLEIFVFSTHGVQNKAKELAAVAFNKDGVKAIEAFEKKAKSELGLEEWDGDSENHSDSELRKQMLQEFNGRGRLWKLWWMTDFTKTRKQIAPLMRDAVKSSAKSSGLSFKKNPFASM